MYIENNGKIKRRKVSKTYWQTFVFNKLQTNAQTVSVHSNPICN